MPVGYDGGMDREETLRFLGEAEGIVQKLEQWFRERNAMGGCATPEERELFTQLELQLKQLKDILGSLKS